jgi:hypothetical protein
VWTNWVVARPIPRAAPALPSVTVVCPCRNEAGNIEQVVRRLPQLGSRTQRIFIERLGRLCHGDADHEGATAAGEC